MAVMKKRILVLKNFDSDVIDQAIIILKEGYTKSAQEGIVTEAEKIIDDYIYFEKYNTDSRWNPSEDKKGDSIIMPKPNKLVNKKSNTKVDKYLNFFLAICCISAIYLFFRLI